ncbi:MAG: universal stress protein [Flavobacteriales bacterium]|nr:universal stress protein [Flavobacteriales bacterium]
MDDKTRFLVPVAFSPQTEVIVEQASNLAKCYDAELNMLYVFDSSRTKGFFSKLEDESKIKQNAESQFEKYVSNQRDKHKIEIKGLFIEGRVYETIVDVARSIKSTLIIMGTNGATGIKSQFIGSNTMRVIKQSPCAVLTIKGVEHKEGCETIVLPLDLTKETTQKVEHAIEFAKMFKSTVRAVSILNTNDQVVVDKLVEQMEVVVDEITKSGVLCKAAIVKIVKGEDSLPMAIIEYAEKVKADLIMIMTQQENNPTEYFIGSRAQTTINKSRIPVLSLIPRETKPLNIL